MNPKFHGTGTCYLRAHEIVPIVHWGINLMNRKITKATSCAEKFATAVTQCAYLFKGKNKVLIKFSIDIKATANQPDASKVKRIETWVALQNELERVSDLEKSLFDCVKEMNSLRSNCSMLKSELKCMKAEASSRYVKYDLSQKLRNEKLKQVQADFRDIHKQNSHTKDETKRLANITQNLQNNSSRILSAQLNHAQVLPFYTNLHIGGSPELVGDHDNNQKPESDVLEKGPLNKKKYANSRCSPKSNASSPSVTPASLRTTIRKLHA